MVTADQDLSFKIAYALYYHRLGSRLYGRLDKLISFSLLICAMGVVSTAVNPFLLGLFVTFLTAWQLVYSPAVKATSAQSQEKRYAELLENFPLLTEDEVRKRLIDLRQYDEDLPGCLEIPAFNAASQKLGSKTKYCLSLFQCLAAYFCGYPS